MKIEYSNIEKRLSEICADMLRLEGVCPEDDFFELDGDSLDAARLITLIEKEFHTKLKIGELYNNSRLMDLAQLIKNTGANTDLGIQRVEKRDYYEASSAQKRMFALNQLNTSSIAYNISLIKILEGEVDKEKFKAACNCIVEKHEILRTSFKLAEGEVVQLISEKLDLPIYYDTSSFENLEDIMRNFVKPFDLGKAPLFRIGLIKLSKHTHALLLDAHHIIFDGLSGEIFMRELINHYDGKSNNELKIQYKDYSIWHNNLLSSEYIKPQEKFWTELYSDNIPILNMLTDFERPMVQSMEGDKVCCCLGSDLYNKLGSFSHHVGITKYIVLNTIYNIFLHEYTGQNEIVVGCPVAGRGGRDTESIIGVFINTLPMRNYINEDHTFIELLKTVRDNTLKAFENQDYQFEELIRRLDIPRDLGRNPLFDTLFTLRSYDNRDLKGESFIIKNYDYNRKVAKFDISVTALEKNDDIEIYFEYCIRLFRHETVIRMMSHYLSILKAVLENPEIKICQLEYISDVEKTTLLEEFNNTETEYQRNKKIHEIFEEQVRKTPHNIAVEYGSSTLTYKELNEKADKLARLLSAKRTKKEEDVIIGIMVERSVEMLVGILGILKAGAAYLPINPAHPSGRIKYILEDSNTKILLTQGYLTDKIDGDIDIVKLEDPEIYKDGGACTSEHSFTGSGLAYVIYTSGTSGNPKGVMIEHKSVVNLVHGLYENIYKKYGDYLNVALLAPYVFDASVQQIFGAVLLGHKLIIVPEIVRAEGKSLLEFYNNKNIDISDGTPIHLSLLSDCDLQQGNELKVKHFLIGGEKLLYKTVRCFFDRFKNSDFLITNVYGPTECCVDSIAFLISRDNIYDVSEIPIGKPLNNHKVYILDKRLKPVPVGVAGEIYISGEGVGRGYVGKPELTAEKYIANPFAAGQVMYRTGDLAKWLEDGNIEFIDRIDQQVKIRGFRIELGEIENKLLGYNHGSVIIKEAVVTVRENDSQIKYLCAYIVANATLTVAELREYLARELPDYMIPSYFIYMDKLPLTNNGKIDRKLLPPPEGNIITGEDYEAPRTEVEKILVDIWERILKSSRIGINNNFFALGGDSIKAIQIAAALQKYGLSIRTSDLMQLPTVKQAAKCVIPIRRRAEQGIIIGKSGLTPIQQWFFMQDCSKNHYNQSILLYKRNRFDEGLANTVLDKLMEHHDALRIVFEVNTGDSCKIYQHNVGIENKKDFRVIELSGSQHMEDMEREINSIEGSLDITRGPLVKSALLRAPEGDYLFMTIHHLVIDTVSWRVIIEDFIKGYQQAEKKEEIVLDEKTASFLKWTGHLHEYASNKKLLEEAAYWLEVERMGQDTGNTVQSIYGAEEAGYDTIDACLSEAITEDILKNVNKAYNTEINDILLTALSQAYREWSGRNKVALLLEGHGREDIFDDIDINRTVGWFTTIYPIVLTAAEEEDTSRHIKEVKEYIRRIPRKGIGYGILKYITEREDKLKGQFSIEPDIIFNYLGQFDVKFNVDNNIDIELVRLPYLSKAYYKSQQSLHIIGSVACEKMRFTFRFDKARYDAASIRKFSEIYMESITKLAEHCKTKAEAELTPSDLTYKGLSFEELDELSELINID